jgi:competence protein ComFC
LRPSFRRLVSLGRSFAEVLLYPSYCEICQKFLEKPEEKVICRSCRDKIKPWSASQCLCCGRFFEGVGESHLCGTCLERIPPFSKHRSCARYEGILRDVILLYKYRGFEILGQYLGDFVGQTLGGDEDIWSGVEAIIPVPLHPAREKKRGFNQAQVLAKRLAKIKNVELLERQLVKVKNVPPQTTLEAEERVRNVHGAFEVKKCRNLEGKVVLLVDDVYTTGSTLGECSSVLKKAGVREIRAVTVARA